ncbi:MAG: extracellular solute-binding protein [bacterium]|nr:extracellular solute-binding protein [bacterium]
MRIKSLLLFVLTALLISLVPAADTQAQAEIPLSVAVPADFMPLFTPELLQEFSSAYPGVRVTVQDAGDDAFYAPPSFGLEDHLNAARTYAESADVLFATAFTLTPHATAAGYFLNLSPLLAADPSMTPTPFIPGVLQNYQWDDGTWAIPFTTDIILFNYDPEAFDAAGVAYPQPTWTLSEFGTAIEALTRRDSSNRVTLPGFSSNYVSGLLLRSFLQTDYIDRAATPDLPRFTMPEFAALTDLWSQLDVSGAAGTQYSGDIGQVPLRLESHFSVATFAMDPNNPNMRRAALLPGGIVFLDPAGFAVSAGTAYPQQAYELVQFLSTRTEFAEFLFSYPTRTDAPTEFFFTNFSAENQAVLREGLLNGLPISAANFSDYLELAFLEARQSSISPQAGIAQAETDVAESLNVAALRAGETLEVAQVATPAPLAPGEIALNFGVNTLAAQLPTQERWEEVIAEFAAADPNVGAVNLQVGLLAPDEAAQTQDCFIQTSNVVPSANLSLLINLDPYLTTDPNYNPADFVPGVLGQMQRDGLTWGYPLVLQPFVMWYDATQFTTLGLSIPTDGWTVDQFASTVSSLLASNNQVRPYSPQNPDITYLLMLVAAYGGLPLDLTTTPPTIAFTAQTNVDAIRQVLDLGKGGSYRYIDLTGTDPGGAATRENPIYDEVLEGFNSNFLFSNEPYQLTLFPRGNQYNAASYEIGAAYISATAQNRDACYRFISTIAQHPELFTAMPARRSQIGAEAVLASQGQGTVDFYQQYSALLDQPSTVIFPSPLSASDSMSTALVKYWLSRAFDNYVLRNADLMQELASAETFARDFLTCTAALPAFNPAAPVEEQDELFRSYAECAVQVDPSMEPLFRDILSQ